MKFFRHYRHLVLFSYHWRHRRQSWRCWGSRPSRFWAGGHGGHRGSWTGRKILYLIMYRKYVRKWWLLKRNRIICPEIALNSQFLPGKSKLFVKLPKKIEIFRKFTLKNRIFFFKLPEKIEICPENRVFVCEIDWKNRNFLTRIHDTPDFKSDWRHSFLLFSSHCRLHLFHHALHLARDFVICSHFVTKINSTNFLRLLIIIFRIRKQDNFSFTLQ